MAIEAELVDKAPDDDLTYNFEYTRWGILSTDTLASGVASSTPVGLTLSSVTISGTQARVTISGGTDGTTYRVKMIATTTAGRDIAGFADVAVSEPEAAGV